MFTGNSRESASHQPKVYIVIPNYQGWQDTLECLESIFKCHYSHYQVVVTDDHSSNGSLTCIQQWAKGESLLRPVVDQPITKPIPYVLYSNHEAAGGGSPEMENETLLAWSNAQPEPLPRPPGIAARMRYPLIFIENETTRGYAGNNNAALQYILAKGDSDYIWLLNNDTVIDGNSLTSLVQKAALCQRHGSKVGIIGSKIFHYHRPNILQGVGGVHNKWSGISNHLGEFEEDRGQYDHERVVDDIDYIMGAAMFVNSNFVKDVGLLSEDYFLYFEEYDWISRGKQRGWSIGYCWDSKVYHKEGGIIGSRTKGKDRSVMSDYYSIRSRILFTRKHFPLSLLTVYLSMVGVILNRLRRRQFRRISMVLKIVVESVFKTDFSSPGDY